jgi:hypothetical protein
LRIGVANRNSEALRRIPKKGTHIIAKPQNQKLVSLNAVFANSGMDIPISGEIRESALELKKRSGLGVPLRLHVRGECGAIR